MEIKTKIEEVRSRLTWRIEEKFGGSDLEITSDPWSRTHTIRIPTSGSEWRDIEYLHELAHATLAERHHLLSTAFFAPGFTPADISALTNPIRTASDWLADDLLMQWCPDEEADEIREHAGYVLRSIDRSLEIVYGGGLFLSQAVRYNLDMRPHDIPRRFRPVANVLLACDPSKPSVDAKQKLINELAALTCRLRVSLSRDDGMDVWRITAKT